MWPQLAWAVAQLVVSLVIGYILRPKNMDEGMEAGTPDVPYAEEGGVIPVLFGTRNIEGMNVLWYGDIRTSAIKKKGGKK